LKHVECNDRSHPIISSKSVTKVKDEFIYESETPNVHNQLLKAIQFGVRLKPTKCNDRSRPILEGLRKFRRQMTVEEQIVKSESKGNFLVPETPAPAIIDDDIDEMDDIDKIRDDLQSTKQLLAIELRNNEALERENKRLATRVHNLEAELARERWNPISPEPTKEPATPDGKLIQNLKDEALQSQKQCLVLENKYQAVAQQLDKAYKENEEQKRKIAELEKLLNVSYLLSRTKCTFARLHVYIPLRLILPKPDGILTMTTTPMPCMIAKAVTLTER
jgi:hypothetical protein